MNYECVQCDRIFCKYIKCYIGKGIYVMNGIEIEGDIIKFKSEFHINIVDSPIEQLGNSATYKTFLFSSLSSAYENRQIESNCQLFFDSTMREISSRLLTKSCCLILDEANYEPKELDKLLQLVRQTGCYLILIGRLYVKQLEYSVDAIWQVKYDGERFSLDHLLKPTKNDRVYDVVACEDSTSVAALYSEYLLREIVPVFGRSNFFKIVKMSYDKVNYLLIADRAKFGPELLALALRVCDKFRTDKVELNLYLPQCFEEICLDLVGEVPTSLDPEFFDYEEFFERRLSDSVSSWDKSNLTSSVLKLKAAYDFSKSRILADMNSIVNGASESKFNMFYKVKLNKVDNTIKICQGSSTVECSVFKGGF